MFAALLMLGEVEMMAARINFSVGYVDPWPLMPKPGKNPVVTPYVDIDSRLITFKVSHDVYTLQLLDGNGDIVYSVYVPSSVTSVTLPSTLNGEYELRLIPNDGDIYFYGYVMF